MILSDGNGVTYQAHFRHVKLSDRNAHEKLSGYLSAPQRWWMVTQCTLHKENCPTNKRPCEALEVFHGEAKCSRVDNFDRRKGLKTSFERALHAMHPQDAGMRGQLWASFWTRVRKPRHN